MHGLYLQALCEGLSTVLDPYRAALLDIERDLMADPHLTAAHVESILEEVMIFFLLKQKSCKQFFLFDC